MAYIDQERHFLSQGRDPSRVLGERGEISIAIDPSASPRPPVNSRLVTGVNDVFSLDGLNEYRLPYTIGETDIHAIPTDLATNSLPIKFPGTDYRVPAELECVSDFLAACLSHEALLNPRNITPTCQ
jgi:hypothetical protein